MPVRLPLRGPHMIVVQYAGLLLASLVVGCASSHGLSVSQLQDLLKEEELRFIGPQPTRSHTAGAMRSAATTTGFYLKPTGFFKRGFEWTDADREIVLTWAKGIDANQPEPKYGFVPLSSLKGNTLRELRSAAARYGYTVLVVFDGAAAVDRFNNYKAPLLYWTILGAYLADGTQSDALSLVKASVWDVKSGALLFSEEAQGRSQSVGPAAFVDDDETILEARRRALKTVLGLIEQRLRN